MLQVNGNITTQPLDEHGPLLGSPEQVAADPDQGSSVEQVYWNSDDDPLSQRLIGHATPRRRCTSADLDPIEDPTASKCRRSCRARAAPPRWQTPLDRSPNARRERTEGGALEGPLVAGVPGERLF